MIDRLSVQDPHYQYSAPPFSRQPQPPPGLASRMEPVPDHGKESYGGLGRLTGRKAPHHRGRFRNRASRFHCLCAGGADVAINYLPSEGKDAQDVGGALTENDPHCGATGADACDWCCAILSK